MSESRLKRADSRSDCLQLVVDKTESPSSSPELREIFKGAAPLGRRVKFYISGGGEVEDEDDEEEQEGQEDTDDEFDDIPALKNIGFDEHYHFVAIQMSPLTETSSKKGQTTGSSHSSVKHPLLASSRSSSAKYANSDLFLSHNSAHASAMQRNSDSRLSYDGALLPQGLLNTEDEDDQPGKYHNSDFAIHTDASQRHDPNANSGSNNHRLLHQNWLASTSSHRRVGATLPSELNTEGFASAYLYQNIDFGPCKDSDDTYQHFPRDPNTKGYGNAPLVCDNFLDSASGHGGAYASLPYDSEPKTYDRSKNQSINRSSSALNKDKSLLNTLSHLHKYIRDGNPHLSDIEQDVRINDTDKLLLDRIADLYNHIERYGSAPNVPGVYRNTDIEQADIAHYHFQKEQQLPIPAAADTHQNTSGTNYYSLQHTGAKSKYSNTMWDFNAYRSQVHLNRPLPFKSGHKHSNNLQDSCRRTSFLGADVANNEATLSSYNGVEKSNISGYGLVGPRKDFKYQYGNSSKTAHLTNHTHSSKAQDLYLAFSQSQSRHISMDQPEHLHSSIHKSQTESYNSSAGAQAPDLLNKHLHHRRQKCNPPPRKGCITRILPSEYEKDLSSALHEQSLQCRCGEDDSADPEKKLIREALRLAMIQCRPGSHENGVVRYNGSAAKNDRPEIPRCSNHNWERNSANQWISSSLVPTSQAENWGSSGQDEVDGTVLQLPARIRSTKGSQNTAKMAGDSPPVESFKKFRSLDFQLRFENVFSTDPSSICSPLPFFNWAESNDVWKNMLKKELTFQRDPGMFKNHPELQPRMRSILLDWLSEVCEVYRLHKETFMLAVDFIDRYLSVTTNVPKTQLQLLGISALFVAAKLEEIYPPKLNEFAYVTDSACTEQEIIKQEMIIVKALKWNLTPMTTNAWLCVYLQVANIDHIHDPALGFVFPQFSTHAFIQISRLCDLCVMDAGSLKYRYSLIAAAALYHHTNEHVVKEVSGLNWADLYPCVRWMAPFAKAILEVGQSPMKFFPQINNEDAHNIQTHNVDMALLDRSLTHQAMMDERECLSSSSPLDLTSQLVCLLEPPSPPTQATDRNYALGSDLTQQAQDTALTTTNSNNVSESDVLSSSVHASFLGGANLETEPEEEMDQQRACS